MATYGQYFYDGLDFISATAIYTDAALLNLAADGWYSQNGVYREQSGGVLLAPAPCPTCQIPCGSPISGSGNSGLYRAVFDFGTSKGAAIITFNPGTDANSQNPVPDKMTWSFDGQSASEYSSYLGGYMTGYIGSPDTCVCCQICSTSISGGLTVASGSNTTSFSNVPIYTYTSGAFQNSGATTTIPAWGGNQSSTGVNDGGGDQTLQVCAGGGTQTVPLVGYSTYNSVMVVPVPPSASSTLVTIEVSAPCVSTFFTFDVACPTLLNSYSCSNVYGSIAAACDQNKPNTYHHAAINTLGNALRPPGQGGTIPATPVTQVGLHDWVFTDAYGVTALPAGFYSITNLIAGVLKQQVMEVSADGVVLSIADCPACNNFIFISAVRSSCEDFCDGTNYTINLQKQTTSCDTFNTLGLNDVIEGAALTAGWYAYAATSTNTSTGVYKQMLIGAGNTVTDIKQCNGTSCITP